MDSIKIFIEPIKTFQTDLQSKLLMFILVWSEPHHNLQQNYQIHAEIGLRFTEKFEIIAFEYALTCFY